MKSTWWKSGDWNAICDVCGFKMKASTLKLRWDGLMVCPQDWEIRHPQELIRPIPDQSKLPWTRPEATDTFVNPSKEGSVLMTAGSSTVVITNSAITSTSQILITGTVPVDPKAILKKTVSVGSGTATITAIVTPLNDMTIYYVII